jgi:hypothetical protein
MTRRLQISITDQQYDLLNAEANRTGLSMAELLRRLVDRAWTPGRRPNVNGFELSVGVWKRPDAAVVGRRPGKLLDAGEATPTLRRAQRRRAPRPPT